MWKVEPNFTIRLGGNIFQNVQDLIRYRDESLFTVRRSDSDGMLGIDFDVRDPVGARIATVRKGVIVQGNEKDYEIVTGHGVYSLILRVNQRQILRIERRGVEGAELDVSVRMYLPNGQLLDLSPTETRINQTGTVIGGSTIRDAGVGIQIS